MSPDPIGFLHAGVDVAPRKRATLERLCRYIRRPPVATVRLAHLERMMPERYSAAPSGEPSV